MVRTNKGRQKIEMKKMTNESNLQVTFSKRRFGLFKKASELCTLCDAKILMIVFSPGGKVFSFGHPDVKDLINRFSNRDCHSAILYQHNNNLQLAEIRQERIIKYLNDTLTKVMEKQEYEKNRRKDLESLRVMREKGEKWYEKDVTDFDKNQTNHMISSLKDIKKKMVREISQYSQLNVSQNYLGQSSGTFTGRNVDLGIDLFDQRRNPFNYNSNMVFPNHGPSFGYNNNGLIVPRSNVNYMSSYNFNLN